MAQKPRSPKNKYVSPNYKRYHWHPKWGQTILPKIAMYSLLSRQASYLSCHFQNNPSYTKIPWTIKCKCLRPNRPAKWTLSFFLGYYRLFYKMVPSITPFYKEPSLAPNTAHILKLKAQFLDNPIKILIVDNAWKFTWKTFNMIYPNYD